MAIYQFLIAVRSGGPNNAAMMLTNADGETTSHIQGMFNRTVRFLTEGLKPVSVCHASQIFVSPPDANETKFLWFQVFVFDGKPPEFKSGELIKRREKRKKAQAELEKATEAGDVEEQDKQSKRLVRAGHKENQDCQRLLELMGVPIVLAPCEAEAQAAALARSGKVYATATEDMDALTFRTPVLLRKMTFANQAKSTIQSMDYAKALEGLGLTHDQFVDLCILLGCDYCDTIRGVGPKTALRLIKEHGSIEKILASLDGSNKKYVVPPDWLPKKKRASNNEKETDDEDSDGEGGENNDENAENNEEQIPSYVQARKLFHNHEVTDDVELKWKPPQTEALTKFLVDEQGFNPERVKSTIEKLEKAHKANQKPQARMDSFFAVKPNPVADAKRKARLQKQKGQEKAGKKQRKK